MNKPKNQLVAHFEQIFSKAAARHLMQYLEMEGIKKASHWGTITFVLPQQLPICIIELLKIGLDRDGGPAPEYTYKIFSLENNSIYELAAYCKDNRIATKELGIVEDSHRISYKEVEETILAKIEDDSIPFNFADSPTAYYNATYEDGKLINTKTGLEIKFKDGAPIRLKTLHTHVLDEDCEKHLEKRKEQMLDKKVMLNFKINTYRFYVELQEPLFLTKEGNKNSRLSNVHCIVKMMFKANTRIDDFDPIEVHSLSQAYTQTSIKHFPDRGSHNRNTFQNIFLEKTPLKEYRMF